MWASSTVKEFQSPSSVAVEEYPKIPSGAQSLARARGTQGQGCTPRPDPTPGEMAALGTLAPKILSAMWSSRISQKNNMR